MKGRCCGDNCKSGTGNRSPSPPRAGDALRAQTLRGLLIRVRRPDQLTPDSDIDIAVILDAIPNRFAEHERTSRLAADLSLEHGTVILFFFAEVSDFQTGRFAIHRTIKEEGIAA